MHAPLGEPLAVDAVHLDAVRGHEPRMQRAEPVAVARPALSRGIEAHLPEAARVEEARPGAAALGKEERLVGDSARWIAAGPALRDQERASAPARRSAEHEPRVAARDPAAAPAASPGRATRPTRAWPPPWRDPTPAAPGRRRHAGSTRPAARDARACSRRPRSPPSPPPRARGWPPMPRPRSRRPRRRPRLATTASTHGTKPVPLGRPAAARCDSSRWQCALTRPGSSTPSPRSVERTVGRARISRTTHPCDATRGNGDDSLADRRTRDRKQPAGLDQLAL